MNLVYEDRTRLLKQMFFEVQNEVGLGRQEEAYQQACKIWLDGKGIPYASKPPHRLMLGDDEVYVLYPDFIVWGDITLELKALARRMTQGDFVQIFNYLKCRGGRLGLMANFGLHRVNDERFIYDPPETRLIENWRYWTDRIHGRDREVGGAAREALRFLYASLGTGYGDEVLQRLVVGTLVRTGMRVVTCPLSKAYFRGIEVHESPLDCHVVENRLLIACTALFDDIQFSVNRGLSYMQALGLEWGVAADFGKAKALVSGLHQGRL